MKRFNELLKEYIDEQNIVVYRLAKQMGVNRTLLQNVFAGRKKFPHGRLGSLLDSTFFTLEQINNLCTAYFSEEYGEEKPIFFEFCNYCLSNKFQKDLENTYKSAGIDLESNNGDVEFLNEKEKIIAAVEAVVSKSDNDIFVSNFDFGQKEMNTIIYNACKNKQFSEFYHYTKYTNSEKENANIIFNSIYYARQDCCTYITDSADFNLIFSKFVLCGDNIVLFDDDANNGSLIKNHELAKHILKKNKRIHSSAKSDIHIFHNAFEYMQFLDIVSHKRKDPELSAIDNHMCSVGFTKEMIDDIATEQIKNSAQVYQQLVSHYELLLDSSFSNIKNQIISFNGLMYFVNTGRFYDFPKALATELKPKHRAEVLQNYLREDIAKPLITNPEVSDFDTLPLAIETTQNQILITFTDDFENSDTDCGIQIVYESENSDIISAFEDYVDYLNVSGKTYSSEYSQKILKTQIDILLAE